MSKYIKINSKQSEEDKQSSKNTQEYEHKKIKLSDIFSSLPFNKRKTRIPEGYVLISQQELDDLKKQIDPAVIDLKNVESRLKNCSNELNLKITELSKVTQECNMKKTELMFLDEASEMAEVGFYKPMYEFANSEQYKDKLVLLRQKQKDMIKNNSAILTPNYFSLDGSASKGASLIKNCTKLLLRSFNNECDILIDKVKFNTVENTRKKITSIFEQLNKLNSYLQLSISTQYLELKLSELNLSYEYALKKQEEKEQQKEERERLREEAKLQKEIEDARKKLNKEKNHYQNALRLLEQQFNEQLDNPVFIEKKAELISQLDEIEKGLEDVDYREANKRAGYVYIISNIGSFGEDVYKIGMTRRLEPMDRINELGDASVPFNFDVHAIIFSDDAPKLENSLHKAFENKKINMVNNRREFFKVNIDDIEKVVKENHNKAVEFNKTPEAQQYWETQKIYQEMK